MTSFVPGLLALLLGASLAALGVALFGWRISRRESQRLTAQCKQLRDEAQQLEDQLDLWLWRTDAHHRVQAMKPPAQAPEADWQVFVHPKPDNGDTPCLWECFQEGLESSLRARMEAHSPLNALELQRFSEGSQAQRVCLQGRALRDANGAFMGYCGTLRVLPSGSVQPQGGESSGAVLTVVGGRSASVRSEAEALHYTVSHDLRAPLRVVEGFSKILKEDYGRALDRIGNDHLDRILGAAQRMHHMIDALLALSKLGNQALQRQEIKLSDLAHAVAEELQRQHPHRLVAFDVEPGLVAEGDPVLLRLVLENLLGNAWKYSGKCPKAEIGFRKHPSRAHGFTVSDNGAGFDMRFADRLFNPFQRLHSASDFQGHGVGLASVRRIVTRHGGEIWAESEVGRGAQFHFTLPPSPPSRARAWPATGS